VRRTTLVGTVCAALAAALAGCAGEDPDIGTNGVGKLSAAKIESKARAAAEGADTVRLSGNVVSQGRTYKLDMRLAKDGGKGQLATKAATFQLLRVGKELYMKADADFWAHQKDAKPSQSDQAAAAKLDGKYVKVPPQDPAYKRFSGFTDKAVLLDGLLGLHGTLKTGDRGTLGGVRTIRVSADDGNGGTLDVSLEGKPYPLRLQRAGGAGVVQLADWGDDFDLSAPEKNQVVDYGEQISTGDE
jgi:hypothetical protein